MANVLIVEDEKNMQEIIAEYMRPGRSYLLYGGRRCGCADGIEK